MSRWNKKKSTNESQFYEISSLSTFGVDHRHGKIISDTVQNYKNNFSFDSCCQSNFFDDGERSNFNQ